MANSVFYAALLGQNADAPQGAPRARSCRLAASSRRSRTSCARVGVDEVRQRPGGRRLGLHRPPPGRLARRRRRPRHRAVAPPRARQASHPAADGRRRRGRHLRARRARAPVRRASTRSTTWSASCTAGAGGATSAARTTTARTSRACTSSCRRRSSTACRARGVRRLLHVSALGASPTAPSEYLRSKGIGEQAMLAADDLEVTVFRPSVVFGPEDRFLNRFALLAKLLPAIARAVPGREVPAGLRRRRGARDAFRARGPETRGKAYELCGPRVYTMRELVEFVCARHRPAAPRRRPVRRAVLAAGAGLLEHLPGQAHDARQLPLDAGAEHLQRAVSVRHPAAGARGRRARPTSRPRVRASAIPSCAGARAASRRERSTRCSPGPVRVVNIGLAGFARDLAANGAAVVQVDWTPPAGACPFRLTKDREGERRGAAPHPRRRAGARRRAPRRRADPGARRRAPDAARRPADRVGAHVRPAARRGVRRDRVRGLGRRPRRRREARRRRAASSSRRTTTTARSGR